MNQDTLLIFLLNLLYYRQYGGKKLPVRNLKRRRSGMVGLDGIEVVFSIFRHFDRIDL